MSNGRIAAAATIVALLVIGGILVFVLRRESPDDGRPVITAKEPGDGSAGGKAPAGPKNAGEDETHVVTSLDGFETVTVPSSEPARSGATLEARPSTPRPAGTAFTLPKVKLPETNTEAVTLLAQHDQSGDGLMREAVATALAEELARNPERLQDFIASMTSASGPALHRLQVILLGRVNAKEATAHLLDLARTGSSSAVRELAIRSLFQNGATDNAPEGATKVRQFRPIAAQEMDLSRVTPLLSLLQSEQDPGVFQLLTESLSSYQDSRVLNRSDHPEITQTFLQLIGREDNPERLTNLVGALLYTRSAEAGDVIVAALQRSDDSDLLQAGLRALSGKPETPVTRKLKMDLALEHPDDSVRVRAIRAISVTPQDGHLVAQSLGPVIQRSPSRTVRMAGIQKLQKCGPAGRKVLEEIASSDPDEQVRRAANFWLQKKGR